MNELLLIFLNWVKDPFNRKEIVSKHADVIKDMYAVEALTKQTTKEFKHYSEVQRRRRGGNAVNRAVLGNRHLKE